MNRGLACAIALVLGACSSGSPAPERGRPAAKTDLAALVAAVRAAGVHGNELQVQPLRDPQVEDLRTQAGALEAQGKYKLAAAVLDRALAMTPGDPDLLQWQAELALYTRAWPDAERLANLSFEKGPRLGGLCRRNWSTIQHARSRRGDAAGADVARRQVDACTVAPPVRM